MIDKHTIGIIRKPHISYSDFSESWVCISEDGPWGICIGAGRTPKDAYKSWLKKVPVKPDEFLIKFSQGVCDEL